MITFLLSVIAVGTTYVAALHIVEEIKFRKWNKEITEHMRKPLDDTE